MLYVRPQLNAWCCTTCVDISGSNLSDSVVQYGAQIQMLKVEALGINWLVGTITYQGTLTFFKPHHLLQAVLSWSSWLASSGWYLDPTSDHPPWRPLGRCQDCSGMRYLGTCTCAHPCGWWRSSPWVGETQLRPGELFEAFKVFVQLLYSDFKWLSFDTIFIVQSWIPRYSMWDQAIKKWGMLISWYCADVTGCLWTSFSIGIGKAHGCSEGGLYSLLFFYFFC